MNIMKIAVAVAVGLLSAMTGYAKDVEVALSCEPEGAKVFLNGQMVCTSAPAIIEIPKKTASKTMIFRFEKEGYETKSVTVAFTKQQLKSNPIVYCKLKKSQPETAAAHAGDPTVNASQAAQRVSRENAGATDMEKAIVRWYFDSDPRGARIFYRVISSVPAEVKNTNEAYLTTTPLEETKGFNIPGLTYANSRDVTIEIKVSKRGYEDQVKRFNVRQALDQQEISGFFELVEKAAEGKSDE